MNERIDQEMNGRLSYGARCRLGAGKSDGKVSEKVVGSGREMSKIVDGIIGGRLDGRMTKGEHVRK